MSRDLYMAQAASEATCRKDASSAYLAGGTDLLRFGGQGNANLLISLKKVPALRGIAAQEREIIRIGAMTTFQEALDSDLVPSYLKEALRYMGSRTKRNMATLGGNVAAMRDDSYLGAVLLAAHAKLILRRKKAGDKRKNIDAGEAALAGSPGDGGGRERQEDCPQGMPAQETVCLRKYLLGREDDRDDLIEAILVRRDIALCSKRYANTVESPSYLTVAMARVDGRYRIGISVKGAGVFFPKEFSDQLDGTDLQEKNFADFAEDFEGLKIPDDQFGSRAYKVYLLAATLNQLYKKLAAAEPGGFEADRGRAQRPGEEDRQA